MQEFETYKEKDERKREEQTVTPWRATSSAPQRMQKPFGLAEAAPPSLAELKARQEAISPTRRRTKPEATTLAFDEVNEETIPVPDVLETSCD